MIDVGIIEGAYNTNNFLTFLEGLLMEMNPYPECNSVLVMDNVSFHRSRSVKQLLDEQ